MLNNVPTLAIGGVDTEENEHCEVCPLSVYRSPRCGMSSLRCDNGDNFEICVLSVLSFEGPISAVQVLKFCKFLVSLVKSTKDIGSNFPELRHTSFNVSLVQSG